MPTAESPRSSLLSKVEAGSSELLLHSGDRLDQPQFHALYERTPDNFKAELIDGVVFVASPVSYNHGAIHPDVMLWAGTYRSETSGITLQDNTTVILGPYCEPQPDALFRLEPGRGGKCKREGEYLTGPPELVIAISYTSWSVDLNAKRTMYKSAGVPEYLVVDVGNSESLWFLLEGGAVYSE